MSTAPSLTELGSIESARAVHETMTLHRALDTRLATLQREGELPYFAPVLGEEGAVVGAMAALEPTDWVFATARESRGALARGVSVEAFLAQVLGRAADHAMGRQAPGHYSSRAARFQASSGVVGAHLLHAVGVGWAARTQRSGEVALAFFGDGAAASEGFHNALNFAGVFRAQAVLVCRNNGSAAARGEAATETVAERAIAYGLVSERVSGASVGAVRAAVARAAARARAGDGATLVEVVTTRLGEAGSDCPIARLRADLVAAGAWDDAAEAALTARVLASVDAALEAARAMRAPDPRSMVDFVYATVPAHLADELRELGRR